MGSLGHVLTVLKGKLAGCTWTIGPTFCTGKDGRSSFVVDKIQNQWVAYRVPAEYPRIAVGWNRQGDEDDGGGERREREQEGPG